MARHFVSRILINCPITHLIVFQQVFCHEKGFPKGLLLRNFVNFYDFDIIEERAFIQWKESVNDAYPGKGKALFQV